MAINWFPGHMHKARKEIAELMPQIDLIIEVLDARIPFSSENPLVPQLRGGKPCIKILNKSDLADPEKTQVWQQHMEQEQGVKTIALTQKNKPQVRTLLDLCTQMVPNKLQVKALILGIPNVGKSTLINTLAGRTVAKTGNQPAVTRMQQRIKLDNNIVLFDTPGFLWPKLTPESCGYRLATTGAIKDTVVEYEDVALFAADYLRVAYPQRLQERYKLEEIPGSDIELMDAIAVKRGCVKKGGYADLYKVSEILLNELRNGTLGELTLETPDVVQAEVAAYEAAEAEKLAKKKAMQKPKSSNRDRSGKPR